MKALITSPVNTISSKLSSHRSAEAHIYEDILDYLGWGISMDYSGKEKDYHQYDKIFVYHGNEWSGSLNLFGGMNNRELCDRITRLSEIDPSRIISLGIGFPEYSRLFQERLRKNELSMWNYVEWDNLEAMEEAEVFTMNVQQWHKFVLGDSHAISLYRRGYNVASIPFKTLHGALSIGLSNFFEQTFGGAVDPSVVEFYFGNIDIRHHFCRHGLDSVKEVAYEYMKQAHDFSKEYDCQVEIHWPLPIENESRKIPKTGHYKGTPFYGSWSDRDMMRDQFIYALKNIKPRDGSVSFETWSERLKNSDGELDFKYMEKPQSVHLSREFYPYWQGLKKDSLEAFM